MMSDTRRAGEIVRTPLLALTGVLLVAGSLTAQSAEEVVAEAMERSRERLEDVENLTVIQRRESARGEPTVDTIYLEKRMVEGHPYLLPPGSDSVVAGEMAGAMALYADLGEVARYVGTGEVDGHETHVLAIDDEEDLEAWLGAGFGSMMEGSGEVGEVEFQEARVEIDAESYLLRKVAVDLEGTREGKTFPVHHVTVSRDYREVKGLPYPHTRVVRLVGVTGAMSPEEVEKAREGIEEMEKELEELPPQQRKMAEAYMGERVKKWREMIESGTLKITTTVEELRVNEGPPGT